MPIFRATLTTTALMSVGLICLAHQAAANEAPVLNITNFVGTVDIQTSNVPSPHISNDPGIAIRKTDKGWTIDGRQNMRKVHCRSHNKQIKIRIGKKSLFRKDYKTLDAFPHITITAPENVVLKVEKSALFGKIDRLGQADFSLEKCANLSIDTISGPAGFEMSGAGTIVIDKAGDVHLETTGASDFTAASLANLNAELSGASDISIKTLSGSANIEASGASDIALGRIAGSLDFEGSGATDLQADYVGGRHLQIEVSGAGDATIKDGDVARLDIETSGTSDVSYGGRSMDASLETSGLADIRIHRPDGHLDKDKSGMGDIIITD